MTNATNRVITAAVTAGVPVHIEGDPGTGKTASLEHWAHMWGWQSEVITAAVRDKGDFMGIPVEEKGQVTYSPPAWVKRLQNAKRGLLVLDELQSSSEAFPLCLRIVQEREVGETKLSDGVSIIAISNPIENAVNGSELPPPVANRFLHLAWAGDFDTWASGLASGFADAGHPDPGSILAPRRAWSANEARVQGAIVSFLRSRPDLRNSIPTDLTQASKGWPSFRSWHNLIRVLTVLKVDDLHARDLAMRGLVGDEATLALLTWMEHNDLYDPADVLKDPTIVDWTPGGRPDIAYALSHSLRAYALAREEKEPAIWDRVLRVIEVGAQHQPDVLTPLARTAFSRASDKNLPQGVIEPFTDMFEKMGTKEAQLI